MRGVVLHHQERIGAPSAFVAHELPVSACSCSKLIGDRNHRLYAHRFSY
jgi:hypothetical protein